MIEEIQEILLSQEQISDKVKEIAAQISADYRQSDLVMIGVLKGAFVFLSDLVRALDIPVEIDFMAVSSYGSSTNTSGVVRILKDLTTDITGRDVIIIEDIIDSGLTLKYLLKNLRARGPKTLEACSLLFKPSRKRVEIPIRYLGFSLPDEFVVGYGLDFGERFRNLPFIATLKDQTAHP